MKKYILRYLTLLSLGFSVSFYSYAQTQPDVRPTYPDSYTVVKGDTLWDISSRFLKDPWRWREIWQNNSQIANPHLIYPGDIIRLVFIDGKPRLVVNGTGSNRYPSGSSSLETIKLSPKIRSEKVKPAIPEIPLTKINAFLLKNRIVDVGVLDNAPHIIAGKKQRLLLGASDDMYARGVFDSSTRDYNIYSKGKEYIDPETKEVIGVHAITLGSAQMKALSGDVGTFTITKSLQEIRSDSGNRLLANQERRINSIFLPSPPENQVNGKIVNLESGVSQVGRLDIVALNLGTNDGIQAGNVLGIYQVGGTIKDRFAEKATAKTVTLPDERAGLLMVFDVFERMSFAIVLEAEAGAKINDIVRNP